MGFRIRTQLNICAMKIQKVILLITLSVVSLFELGCAASGPKYSEYVDQIPKLNPESSRIFFYRKSSFIGSGVQPDIRLNGRVVGESKPNGFFFVDTEPGNHLVSAKTAVEKTFSIRLSKGEVGYIRSSIEFVVLIGIPNFDAVLEANAWNEMRNLRYTGEVVEPAKAAVP